MYCKRIWEDGSLTYVGSVGEGLYFLSTLGIKNRDLTGGLNMSVVGLRMPFSMVRIGGFAVFLRLSPRENQILIFHCIHINFMIFCSPARRCHQVGKA